MSNQCRQLCVVLLLIGWVITAPVGAQDWQADRPLGSPEIIGRYQQLLARDPFSERALAALLREYGPRGGLAALLQEYGRQISDAPDDASLYMILARLRAWANQPEAALTAIDRAVELGFDRSQAYVLRAHLRRQLGDGPGAIDDCRLALERTDRPEEQVEILRSLGDIQLSLGQSDEALGTYRRIADIVPGDRFIQQELVHILYDAGYFQEALNQADEIVSLAGGDTRQRAEALQELAVLQEELGYHEQAIDSWNAILAVTRPGHWLHREAQEGLVRAYRGWGRLDRLLQEIEQRLPERSRDGFLLSTRARILRELGQCEDSVAAYRVAISRIPGDREIRLDLASLLGDMGRAQQSLQVLEEALERWPGDLSILERLVEGYLGAQRPFDASFVLRSHEDQVGDDPQALSRLIRLYQSIPDTSAADRALQRLAALHPGEVSLNLELVRNALETDRFSWELSPLQAIRESGSSEEYLELVHLLAEHGQVDRALVLAAEGRARFPDSQYLAAAWMRLVRGQGMESALRASREVVLMASDWSVLEEAFDTYYQTLMDQGLADWAVDYYAVEFGREPFDYRVGRLLLILQIARGDRESAGRTLAALLAISPSSQAPREWAVSSLQRWPSPGVLPFLRRLGESDPAGTWRYELIGARILAAAGQHSEAQALLERLRDRRGDTPAILYAVGETYAELAGTVYQELGCWTMGRALDADPTSDRFRLGRIDCLRQLGKLDTAYRTALAGFDTVAEAAMADLLIDRLLMVIPSDRTLAQVIDELRAQLDRTNPTWIPWLEQRSAAWASD